MSNLYCASLGTAALTIVPPSGMTVQLLRVEMWIASSAPAIEVMRASGYTLVGSPVTDTPLADGGPSSGCTLRGSIPTITNGGTFVELDCGHGPNDVSSLGITVTNGDALVLAAKDGTSSFWTYYSVY